MSSTSSTTTPTSLTTIIAEVTNTGGTASQTTAISVRSIYVWLDITSLSGTLGAKIYTYADDSSTKIQVGEIAPVANLPANPVVLKVNDLLDNIEIEATYTGATTYEIRYSAANDNYQPAEGHRPLNSYYTALTGGETWTGSYERVDKANAVVVSVKADVEGTLYMDQSDDGIGTAESELVYVAPAGVNQVHRIEVTRPYYRTRFVNGASAQSTFSLNTRFGDHTIISAPLNINLNQYSDAIVVRNVPSSVDISAGRFGGFEVISKWGSNPTIASGTVPEDIWGGGGTYTGFPTSADTVDVVSTDANDANGGTGAEIVRVTGLDANYLEITEDVTMAGLTSATTTASFLRVNALKVVQSNNGADDSFNAGTISAYQTATPANIFATIQAGRNESQTLAYTVPADKSLVINKLEVMISRSVSATGVGYFYIKEFGMPPKLTRGFSLSNTEEHQDESVNGQALVTLPEKTDFTIRMTSVSATVAAYALFHAIQVDNT